VGGIIGKSKGFINICMLAILNSLTPSTTAREDKEMKIKKVLRIGNKKGVGQVYCKIEYKEGKLSISGVESPNVYGNCRGGCGQINPVKVDTLAKGWTYGKLARFNSIWAEWHLNDMKAGTPKQTEALKGKNLDYDKAVEYLKSINLYEDNGYKYGSAWLKVEVPQDVIDFLEALPNTDRQPAWC
jgi:hypothetical protein